MGIIKQSQAAPKEQNMNDTDQSMIVADEKIDRDGNSWKREGVWIRSEHLGKMKVIGHFEKQSIQQIIDAALTQYIRANWDDSMAMKKMMKRSGY